MFYKTGVITWDRIPIAGVNPVAPVYIYYLSSGNLRIMVLTAQYLKNMTDKKDAISRQDWKYMEKNPYGDPDFSEEHNKRVIAEVDEWNDKHLRDVDREYSEKTAERTNAAAAYLKNVTQGQGISDVSKYFGKGLLAYLRGEEVVRKLRENPGLVDKIKKMHGGKLKGL